MAIAKRIELKLPEAPSGNRYWRHARGRTYRSAEANEYRELVWVKCREFTRLDAPFPKGVEVEVTATWHRSRKAGDLDNRWKVLGDALNGIVWDDDSQITVLHLYRKESPRNGYMHIIVEAVQ